MANSLAELVVNLTAETASFSRKMDSAASDLKRFGQTADSVMRGVRNVAATLGVAFSANAIIDFGKRSLETMDRINKLSQSTGVQVEALSAMAYAGRLADIELDTLAKNLARLSKNAYEAADGGGASAEAFKRLGISVRGVNGDLVPVDQLVVSIADKFSTMRDGTEKTALAMQLFGKSGADMIPLLNQGGASIASMANEARKAGFAFSKESAQAAEDFKDNMERLDMVLQGFGNRIMGNLVKSMTSLSDEMTKTAQNDSLVNLADNIAGAIKRVVIVVDASITGIKMLALRLEDIAELGDAIRAGQTGNPGAAFAQYYLNRKDRAAEWDRLDQQWKDRSLAIMYPTAQPRLSNFNNPDKGPHTPPETKPGKDLTAQIASAKAEIASLLAQMAAENFNVAEKVRSDWSKSIDKIAENFRKFPQLARLPEVQSAGGKDIMLFHAKIQAETAARAAQLEQDIKLLQDATKAYEQILKEIGTSDYPNIPNKPVSVPVLSDTPWTPYEVELDKLKRNTEEMGQLASDVWYQTRTAAEAYAFELERLNILLDNGKISQETYNRAVDQLKARLDRNTISMREFGYELGQVAQNSITHWRGWRDMVDQLTDALIKLAFQLLVVNRLKEALDKSGKGGGLLGGLIGGLSGSWGGFRADGGPMDAGKWYIAGERGPEPIYMGSNGYAFATDMFSKMKGGGDTVIHIDARGADAGVEARIMRAMSIYKNQAVQESVMAVEERRRRS